jgi:voltage-gated potassium channel
VVARWRPLHAVSNHRRRRLSLIEALLGIATVTTFIVLTSGVLVTFTDPAKFPNPWLGFWWAITTMTTVGYGDVVPESVAGRILGSAVMLAGIAALAFLTAIGASAIVVSEVSEEGQERIDREERDILAVLRDIQQRLERIEQAQREKAAQDRRRPPPGTAS